MQKCFLSSIFVASCLARLPRVSHAEVTLLKQQPMAENPLERINVQVGGSLRSQINHQTGGKDTSFNLNGFDSGTRFRFSVDYKVNNDIEWINYYELGVNIPKVLGWNDHYAVGATKTTRRQWFTGLNSATYGQLTYGQQNSVYYDVVGMKTDIWDDDLLAQASGVGINGDYDGSYRGRKMLKYKKKFENFDFYTGVLFADDSLRTSDGFNYKRKGGGSLGIDYRISDNLTWGTAWNCTKATLSKPNNQQTGTYN